jgi:hypothetical protein
VRDDLPSACRSGPYLHTAGCAGLLPRCFHTQRRVDIHCPDGLPFVFTGPALRQQRHYSSGSLAYSMTYRQRCKQSSLYGSVSQTKETHRPKQSSDVIQHCATRFSPHEPSPGATCYKNKKRHNYILACNCSFSEMLLDFRH